MTIHVSQRNPDVECSCPVHGVNDGTDKRRDERKQRSCTREPARLAVAMEYPLVEPADDRARKLDWRVGKQVRCRRVPVFLCPPFSFPFYPTLPPYSNNPAGPFSIALSHTTLLLGSSSCTRSSHSLRFEPSPSNLTRINPQILD